MIPRIGLALIALSLAGCGRQVPSRTASEATSETTQSSSQASTPQSDTLSATKINLQPLVEPWLEQVVFANGREAKLFTILEIVGGGVAAIDYDRDGKWDLFFPGGGSIDRQQMRVLGKPSSLVRNVGQGALVEHARIDTSRLYSHGASVVDWDHDGFSDVMVYGYSGVLLFRNQGDGTFCDVTRQAGLQGLPWTSSVAFTDLNADGLLDLYGACYVQWDLESNFVCPAPNGQDDVCSPNAFEGTNDWARLGSADGGFQNFSGLETGFAGKGLGIVSFRPDCNQPRAHLLVANDMQPNFWFAPDEHGRASDSALHLGLAVDDQGKANASMGLCVFDLENDGHFDLFVTHFDNELHAVYSNQGAGIFQHATRRLGLQSPNVPPQVDFGIVAADWDADGDEDLLYVAGHVQYFPDRGSMEQVPVVLENRGHRKFVRVMPSPAFNQLGVGRGVALVDWNGDGRPDAATTDLLGSPKLYTNESENDYGWLEVELVGTRSPRTPLGAIVEIENSLGQRQYRQLCGGGSYLSNSQASLFFGLAGESCRRVTVYWPSGDQSDLAGEFTNQRLLLVEPQESP